MTDRAFAIVVLAFLLTMTALVALYAQELGGESSLGSFPVPNEVAMKGKDCQ